jgi:hypothetical protein
MEYEHAFAILDERVRPERQRRKPDGSYALRKPLPQRWWQFAEKRPALRQAIAGLDSFLAITLHSKVGLPAMISTGQVISNGIAAIATNQFAILALLSSGQHYWWAITNGSSIKGDLRYTQSDIYDTLPKPTLSDRMHRAGGQLDAFRRGVMEERRAGLTALYDLVHNMAANGDDITHLREIHIEIDEAVRGVCAR